MNGDGGRLFRGSGCVGATTYHVNLMTRTYQIARKVCQQLTGRGTVRPEELIHQQHSHSTTILGCTHGLHVSDVPLSNKDRRISCVDLKGRDRVRYNATRGGDCALTKRYTGQ